MQRLVLAIVGCLIFICGDLVAKDPPIRLVYEVDAKKEARVDPATMKKLVTAVDQRVNPDAKFFGLFKIPVRQFGNRQIEILVPAGKPKLLARIQRTATRPGTLEFRILADRRDSRHKQAITQGRLTDANTVRSADGSQQLGWWVPVTPGNEKDFTDSQNIATRTRKYNGRKILEVLVVKDPYGVTGAYLQRIQPSKDERGRPSVRFHFNKTGGQLFGWLTHENRPDEKQNVFRRLGIILDGKLYSAPIIRTVIHSEGEITGNFTKEEVQDIVDVLNTGSLPLPIRKVEPIKKVKPAKQVESAKTTRK